MAASNIHTQLPNGKKIPLLGLGTWQSKPGEVRKAVEIAIGCGYRHIDGAFIYQNEAEVGQGIKAKIDDGTISRGDVFVTSKLWVTCSHPDDVERSCRQSLNDLGLEYIDLYLIHNSVTLTRTKGLFPLHDDGTLIASEEDYDFLDTWRAMEPLVDKGLVRAIGVSNFNVSQIQRILDLPPRHPIANNQVENHPLLAQPKLVDFCQKHGITVTAYSPLGSPERPGKKSQDPVLLDDPVVREIAESRGVTPALVLIRFQLHRGLIVIPKSVTPSRIEENFQALNFELSEEDFKRLQGLDKNHRLLKLPQAAKLKNYPFADDL